MQVMMGRFEQALNLTLEGLDNSLQRHMPANEYRNFYRWAISAENPHQSTFLEVMGIPQLVKLTVTLLDGLVADDDWDMVQQLAVFMNVYQLYEIVSDNLAIGLARLTSDDRRYDTRRQILHSFNQAMVARLKGDPRSSSELLKHIAIPTRHISIFNQSLSREKHIKVAQTYLEQHEERTLHDLASTVWYTLVANIDTCRELAGVLKYHQTHDILRIGLASRYQAVNRLLDSEIASPQELLEVGTQSILVIPTLAYYVAVLAEIVTPNKSYNALIEDGSLYQALYDAALLVRLLNDLGTGLVMLTGDQQESLLDTLLFLHEQSSQPAETLVDFLANVAGDHELFTRIQKDIRFGEFNVGLYGLVNRPISADVLADFANNIAYFCREYASHYVRLEQNLAQITNCLQDDTVSSLIWRFVQFHIALYSQEYRSQAGEYAV